MTKIIIGILVLWAAIIWGRVVGNFLWWGQPVKTIPNNHIRVDQVQANAEPPI